MAKEKVITYSETDRAIVSALNGSEGMTFAALKDATGMNLVAGHISSALRKHLIKKVGSVEIQRPVTRTVSTYCYADSDIKENEKGKAYNYTDGEREVLDAASKMDGEFTLAQLASAMGLEKLSSGRINSLVKKGNITKGNGAEVESFSKSEVGVYAIDSIPSDF
jgi:serine protease inhibitor